MSYFIKSTFFKEAGAYCTVIGQTFNGETVLMESKFKVPISKEETINLIEGSWNWLSYSGYK